MARLDKMLWDKDHTASVRASKIRSFGIYEYFISPNGKGWKLLGWYNENSSFYFGYWKTAEEAIEFLEGLHKQIEE